MANGAPSARRAPRIFVDDPEAVGESRLTLRGSAAHRLTRVLRLRRGDSLEVIHGQSGRFYRVELIRLGDDVVEAEICESRPVRPEPAPWVILCPSLLRAQRFDFVMEKATELGVSGVRPVRATRSLAKAQGRQRLARWQRIITEAAEQCRREERPELDGPVDLEALVAAEASAGAVRLFASEREPSRRIATVLEAYPSLERVEILVGPEGGFTPSEAEAAVSNGWIPVTLGPRPLRAETAAVVATALVQEALMERR